MQVRQGDVLIESVDCFPEEIASTEETLLVRGEGRYHGHFIVGNASVFNNTSDDSQTTTHYIEVIEDSKVKHLDTRTLQFTQEHAEIDLKPGKYRVIRQREYDPYLKVIRILQD